MSQTHEHDAHAPIETTGDISEFEVLELAVRELANPEGAVLPRGPPAFSVWPETIGPSRGSKLWPRPGPTGTPRTHANWFKSHNDIRPCGVASAEPAR